MKAYFEMNGSDYLFKYDFDRMLGYSDTHTVQDWKKIHSGDKTTLVLSIRKFPFGLRSEPIGYDVYENGARHCNEGPAFVRYVRHKGIAFQIRKAFRRLIGKPLTKYEHYVFYQEAWFQHGKEHREGAPAFSCYDDGELIGYVYIDRGRRHNVRGPAVFSKDTSMSTKMRLFQYTWLNYPIQNKGSEYFVYDTRIPWLTMLSQDKKGQAYINWCIQNGIALFTDEVTDEDETLIQMRWDNGQT